MPSSKKQINDKAKILEKKIEETQNDIRHIKAIADKLEAENANSFQQLEILLQRLGTDLQDASNNLKRVLLQSAEIGSMQRELSTLRNELVSIKNQHISQEKKFQNEIKDLRNFVDQEMRRRDGWGSRAAEIKWCAKGRPVWIIKCPAPEDKSKVRWGDYSFALALKRELEKRDIYVRIDTREDWGCEADADVTLVLRGVCAYRPDRRNTKCMYIMWNISHPDMVTEEEYHLYDVVCVASRYYAGILKKKLSVPVIPLLQCTDTNLFFPRDKIPVSFDQEIIFIGNSRGVARNCVVWAVEDQLPLRIWGGGWNVILKDHLDMIEDPYIENSRIPDLYRSSRVTLNDHWDDMREKQFINNRIFDALACGLPVISDTCQELYELFPEAVLHYRTKEEFDGCIHEIYQNYDAICAKVMEQWPLIQQEYSFKSRAGQLLSIAEKYRKRNKESEEIVL